MQTSGIANELREWVTAHSVTSDAESELMVVADRIDSDHDTRMEQCRRETKRATLRYLSSVIEDYKRDIKRVRKPIKCRACKWSRKLGDGRMVCTLRTEMQHLVEPNEWCSHAEKRMWYE